MGGCVNVYATPPLFPGRSAARSGALLSRGSAERREVPALRSSAMRCTASGTRERLFCRLFRLRVGGRGRQRILLGKLLRRCTLADMRRLFLVLDALAL